MYLSWVYLTAPGLGEPDLNVPELEVPQCTREYIGVTESTLVHLGKVYLSAPGYTSLYLNQVNQGIKAK